MSDEILQAILEIKEDIGGMKADVGTIKVALPDVFTRVGSLEESRARARGAAKAWGILSAPLGAVGGALAHYILKKNNL